MIPIPERLKSLFTGVVRDTGDQFVIEIPKSEVETGHVDVGGRYRVAVIDTQDPSASGGAATDSRKQPSEPTESDSRDHPEPPVEAGEQRRVTIETLGEQGDGIARVGRGFVVIVPGVEPGDEPTVRIADVTDTVAFAEVVE